MNAKARVSAARLAYEVCCTAFSDRTFIRRYFIVGVGNLSINFGVFYVLYHFLDVWYVLAALIGFTTRFIFKFVSLRFWVFGHKTTKSVVSHFIYFSLLEAGSYVLSLPFLVLLVEWLHFPPPAGVILTIITFYVFGMLMARLIFKTNKQQ
jgi:putative flippase GtrA